MYLHACTLYAQRLLDTGQTCIQELYSQTNSVIFFYICANQPPSHIQYAWLEQQLWPSSIRAGMQSTGLTRGLLSG